MTNLRFIPFNPHEPRPAVPPPIRPGVLVAGFDATGARTTPWIPLNTRLEAVFTCPPDRDRVEVVFAVAWDGAGQWNAVPVAGGHPVVAVTGMILTICMGLAAGKKLP